MAFTINNLSSSIEIIASATNKKYYFKKEIESIGIEEGKIVIGIKGKSDKSAGDVRLSYADIESPVTANIEALRLLLSVYIGGAFSDEDINKIALGLMPGLEIMRALGERETIGTTVAGEDIWRGNELTPAPTSHTKLPIPAVGGEQMTVVSESDADNGATATGALTVMIHYLDINGDEQTEILTIDGTMPVNTEATDMTFINDFHVLTVGSNGVSEGHIKIYKTGSAGLVYNMIAAGGNKSLVPMRKIPTGKTLLIKRWHATEAQGKRVAFRIRSTDHHGTLFPGVFIFKGVSYLKQSVSGDMEVIQCVPELSIIKVTGWAIIINAEGSCGWWGVLIDNTLLL